MKNKKPNAELVWKQLEDLLAPRLRLSVIDRTVYSHLLRHSRLEGKLRLRFSIQWLGRNIGYPRGRCARPYAGSRPKVHCAWASAAKPGTWSRCGCPTRFAPGGWTASRAG